MKPTFIIDYCFNCSQHNWNTRHNEAKYLSVAQSVETAIKAALPNADMNCRAGHFSFDMLESMSVAGANSTYQPTEHIFRIAERVLHQRPQPAPGRTDMQFIKMDTPAIGGMEVYFNGVRLFSKIQSGLWPHIDLLAQKCVKVYNDFMAG